MSGRAEAVPLVRRRRALLIVLAVAVVAAGVGGSSPLWIKSPQQVAADARPPALTVLTAPVERKILRDTVILRGDVRPSLSVEVTPSSRVGGTAIVTAVKVKAGETVSAGMTVLEVAGRPLFALPGAVPAYRDLKPGADGKDIAQLQAALAGLGFDPGERNGLFGAGTKRALTAFYKARGYAPLPVSDSDARQVADATKQVNAAVRQVADAREASEALAKDPSATAAQRSAATKALARSQQDLAEARKALTDLEAVTGPMLPQGEYTFLPAFPARVDALKATVGQPVASPAVTFSAGVLVVTAKLTAAQQGLCKPGAAVEITGDNNVTVKGVITSIGELEVAGPSDKAPAGTPSTSGYPAVITPTIPLDPRLSGQNVRLTVESASSGTEQLVVPVSALYASADGRTYVTRRGKDGAESAVPVEAGMSAQGYVAVRTAPGALEVGDLVTVGVGTGR
ncbi:peptidoglycan-binding protein [Longispora urticae]